MRKLTIGISTYDDFDGVYFTIQSLRTHHPEVMDEVEFVIVNNNPKSAHGRAVHKFSDWITEPLTYIECGSYSSTAIRNKIFDVANTPYVLCMDCHVLIVPGAIKKLIEFYDSDRDDNGNLLQGPILYDNLTDVSSHFDLKWGDYMWGVWASDDRACDPEGDPFEIPAQGLGLFSCRKDKWLGFNKLFRGFGGEEGYIHHKYKNAGRKTLCLPFLRWVHRFERPGGVPYTVSIEDRFRNYMIGFQEIGKDTDEILKKFESAVSSEFVTKVKGELGL